MLRRFVTGVCAAVLIGLAAAAPAQSNVLILIADDVGVDNVSVYAEGPNPPPTPNIDQLAFEGVLFRNAWANPKCSPTRATIQTGRYSFRTGVGTAIRRAKTSGPQNLLNLSEVTIPEFLSTFVGHSFGAFGKWHLGGATNGGVLAPNMAGWTHFSGFLGVAVDYFVWPRTVNGQTNTCTNYQTTQIVDDALAWIASVPEPWVCYVSFGAAHSPFHSPPASLHTQTLPVGAGHAEVVPFYKAAVEAMDTEIGRLLNSLEPEMRRRTNVIFTADNGTPRPAAERPFLATHAKGTPFEGGVNVPLIVSGPIVSASGRESDALVGCVDLFSTINELCGVRVGPPGIKIDSVSFVPLLRDPSARPTRTMVFAEAFDGWNVFTSGFATIRNDRYKLIRAYSPTQTADAFFDLEADPFERNNLLRGPVFLLPEEVFNYGVLAAELTVLRRG